MQGHLPGFEVFRDDENNVLVKNVIRTELTRKLSTRNNDFEHTD
jgi:hypothetical protein